MKKTLALLLALVLIVAMAPAAFATSQSTKLTTTVPGATYTFTIPKDTEIAYNATDTSIGYVTVTESSGFALGKDLQIELKYSAFTSENVSTTIPYKVLYSVAENQNTTDPATRHSYYSHLSPMIFKGSNTGTVASLAYAEYSSSGMTHIGYVGDLGIVISASDWGKALAGDYTSTITFTASVVAAK